MAIARKLEGHKEILLVLTPEEAQVLVDIYSMVGGSPETSRRGLVGKDRHIFGGLGV